VRLITILMTTFLRLTSRFSQLSGSARAAWWITISACCYVVVITIVRGLAPNIHVFEIVFFRSLFGALFMAPWVMRRGVGVLRTPRSGLLILRGAGAFVAGSCLFYAATLLPLGEFMAITFTRPILASIGAILFLGEIARGRRWTAIFVGFAGALIVIRPGFQVINIGMIFVLAAVMVQVANTLIIKFATRTVEPDVIAVYHAIVIAPIALIPTLFVWTMPGWEQFLLLAAAGMLTLMVQRSMTRAFVAADATVVLAFGFIRLPVAALAGFVFFSEVPILWVWVGGALIIAASLFLVRRENVADRVSSQDVSKE
jgi:drug/metabolite transporter (DMT)-like permease